MPTDFGIYKKSEFEFATNRQSRGKVCRHVLELRYRPSYVGDRSNLCLRDFCTRVLFDNSPAYLIQLGGVLYDLKQACLTHGKEGELWENDDGYYFKLATHERALGAPKEWHYCLSKTLTPVIEHALLAAIELVNEGYFERRDGEGKW